MSLPIKIEDGRGSGDRASVENNALVTVTEPHPPFGKSKTYLFRQNMTTDGTATGTSSMKVAGTLAAPVKFYIPAGKNDDRYITTISFVIAGAGATLSEFSTIAALTNGCKLYYERERGEKIIHEALKSNFDFVRLCIGTPAFGDAATAFRASNVVGTSDAYIPVLYLSQIIPPYGIKLDAGSNQRLVFEVRDDTTSVSIDAFDAICYGFDREP